jgi:hypothetical protein
MGRSSHNPYINKYTINDAIILNNSLMGLFFDYDSGPIVGSNNFDISSNMTHYNLFIFAYNGSTRSDIPTTQLFYKHDATGGLEWWPVMIKEYIGGSNIGAFTSLKTINTYTGQFTIGSYDDFINDNYPFDGAQYPQDYIGGRISTK